MTCRRDSSGYMTVFIENASNLMCLTRHALSKRTTSLKSADSPNLTFVYNLEDCRTPFRTYEYHILSIHYLIIENV